VSLNGLGAMVYNPRSKDMTARTERVGIVSPVGASDPAGGAAGWWRVFPRRSALFLVPKEEKQ